MTRRRGIGLYTRSRRSGTGRKESKRYKLVDIEYDYKRMSYKSKEKKKPDRWVALFICMRQASYVNQKPLMN